LLTSDKRESFKSLETMFLNYADALLAKENNSPYQKLQNTNGEVIQLLPIKLF